MKRNLKIIFVLTILASTINVLFFKHKNISQLKITTPIIDVSENKYHAEIKTVYLTFDADMTPFMKKEYTEKRVLYWYSKGLVDYLEKEKIPATIFVTGMFAEMYPETIKTMATYPTIEIANHTYDHAGFESPCYGLKILKNDSEKIDEIKNTQNIIKTLTNKTPKYFRYPGLCHKKSDDALVNKLGLSVANTGLISGDAFNKSSKGIISGIMKNVRNNDVIIMHLGGQNAPAITGVFMKELVTRLKAQNYVFKVLP